MTKEQYIWVNKNLKGLSYSEFREKFKGLDKEKNRKLFIWWSEMNRKPDKLADDNQQQQIDKDQSTDKAEKKSDEIVATIDYAQMAFQGKEKKKSQTDRLYELLSDGQSHSTEEIKLKIYGNNHLGLSRIGARIQDLRNKGINIPKAKKDKNNKTIYWYQIIV